MKLIRFTDQIFFFQVIWVLPFFLLYIYTSYRHCAECTDVWKGQCKMICLTMLYRETKRGPVPCLLKSTSMFCRSCTSIPLPRSGFPHVYGKFVPVALDCMQLLMEPFFWIFFLSHLSLDGRRYTSEKDEQYYKLNLEDFSAFLKSNFWRKTYIICKCITCSYFSVDFYHSKSRILRNWVFLTPQNLRCWRSVSWFGTLT